MIFSDEITMKKICTKANILLTADEILTEIAYELKHLPSLITIGP